jgi:mono/diheme cytochrome c family protein
LQANCGHCHHADAGRVPVPLNLALRAADPAAQRAAVLASLLERPLRSAAAPARAVVPGDAEASVVVRRMRGRGNAAQMPPLGTRHVDRDGLALVERWIHHDLNTAKEENLP